MKKILFSVFAVAVLLVGSTKLSQAQSYRTAVGLGLDFGSGATLVGPMVKHFFNPNAAGQAELLFGDHTVAINAFYQYQNRIAGAPGLDWYVGGGPGLHFFSYKGFSNTTFALKPMAGLDYKIGGAPIAVSLDWRPSIFIGSGDTNFEPARFGLGLKFTLK